MGSHMDPSTVYRIAAPRTKRQEARIPACFMVTVRRRSFPLPFVHNCEDNELVAVTVVFDIGADDVVVVRVDLQ
jgi:hypothetical protein